jgi:hypothetical protein
MLYLLSAMNAVRIVVYQQQHKRSMHVEGRLKEKDIQFPFIGFAPSPLSHQQE